MTIYFDNPFFSTHYGKNIFNLLTKRFNFRKHWYITEYLLKRKKDAGILLDIDQNSFDAFYVYKFRPLNRLVTLLEAALWLLLHGVNPFRIKIAWKPQQLREGDVLFSFAFVNLDQPECRLGSLAGGKYLKVFHLSHYMFGTGLIARHGRECGVDFYAAESNLARYPYFRQLFPDYRKDVYLLPFVPQPRFTSRTPFLERRNKCLAMGTFSRISRNWNTADYLDFFRTDTIHGMRAEIFENRERIAPWIESSIGYYNAEVAFKQVRKDLSPLRKLAYSAWNIFSARQSKYFNVPSDQQYNGYRMFVVPEENSNLPGIGFVEGMACGCAYLGIDDPMYRDIGLVPGRHYIAYDNTIEGLVGRIRYYQEHPDELERIAAAGREFVAEHFSGERVAELFWNDLLRLSRTYLDNGVARNALSFESSFVDRGQPG